MSQHDIRYRSEEISPYGVAFNSIYIVKDENMWMYILLEMLRCRINCDICAQVATTEVTEDNGEYSGAFGGRVPHLCLPEDAGVDLDNPPHPLFCQQGDVSSFMIIVS